MPFLRTIFLQIKPESLFFLPKKDHDVSLKSLARLKKSCRCFHLKTKTFFANRLLQPFVSFSSWLLPILPFKNHYKQEKSWTNKEIEQLEKHKKIASRVIHTQETYSRGCYYKRDRQLVDASSICICYQYKNSGGTAYTVKYAKEHNITIINI